MIVTVHTLFIKAFSNPNLSNRATFTAKYENFNPFNTNIKVFLPEILKISVSSTNYLLFSSTLARK